MTNQHRRCETCAYWYDDQLCIRYPPRAAAPGGMRFWPMTGPYDLCGEHKARGETQFDAKTRSYAPEPGWWEKGKT